MLKREVEKPLPAIVLLGLLVVVFVTLACCRALLFALPDGVEYPEPPIRDVDR